MQLKFFNFIIFGLSFLLKDCHCSTDNTILLITDSQKSGLYGVSSETYAIYSIAVKRVFNPIAIHYNEINERIYWSDVMLKEIRSTSISGHDDVVIRTLGQGSVPDGLAVDPVSEKVFYTDTGNRLIALMDLDGSNHAIIVSKDIEKPRAIVLDTMNGKIYWSDWGIFPKIETANYDGTDRKALITSEILLPNALTIDFADKWMYWGDAGTHNIERARLYGSERKVIFFEEKAHFFSMLVFSNKLFYTDWQKRSVMAISLNGESKPMKIGNGSFLRLNDISRLKQKPTYPETNACSQNKGGCSHICLPRTNGKHVCLCPTGFIIKDGSSCIRAKIVGTCEPLKAKIFTTITPKECLTQDSPNGKVCNVECPDGFIYDGFKHEIECEDNGYWNDIVHDCIDVTRPIIHNCPQDWKLVTAKKGREIATVTWEGIRVTDNSGVKPILYASMKSGVSLQEGEYMVNIFAVDHAGHFAGCEFTIIVTVRRCGDVPVPERGYVISGHCPDYYGAKCNIACNTGYQLSTNANIATIECVLNENNKTMWKADHLSCNPITCPQITSPNTEVTGCNNPPSFGSVCEQVCSKGFERIAGSTFRICKHDGSWSGEDLTCKQKTVECPKLTPSAEVTVSGCSPPYEAGSVCEQKCSLGYNSENHGTGLRLCKQDGTWSGNDIRCVKSTAGEATKIVSHFKDSDDRVDTAYYITSILIGGVVLIVSILLIQFGLVVYLKKQSENVETKNNRQHRSGTENEVEGTCATPLMSELKDITQ